MRHFMYLPIRAFSAAPSVDKTLLSKLRKQTGVPFINCKKALAKFDNDFDQAKEWLLSEAQREGWTRATKLQTRPMSQGLIAVLGNSTSSTMIEVNCETDFVAKNEKFIAMVTKLVEDCSHYFQGCKENEISLKKADLDKIPASDHGTLADVLALTIGNLGENMALRRGVYLQSSQNNLISSYVHPSSGGVNEGLRLGKYGAVLELVSHSSEVDEQSLSLLGRELGQHIIGMNPRSLGEYSSSQEKEQEGYSSDKEDAEEETRLLQQEFLLDNSLTVGGLLQENGVEIVRFSRFACGEELPEDEDAQ